MKLQIIEYLLIILLVFAVYFDLTRRKIPNRITMPAILIGIIWSTVNSGLNGFLFSIFGFLFGLAVFLVPYMAGGMGAGDVKLMAAIGSMMGWRFTLLSSIGTALFGGVIVILYMFYKGGMKLTLINAISLGISPLSKWIFKVTGNQTAFKISQYFEKKKTGRKNDYIPYALAIFAGTLIVLFFGIDGVLKI